MIKKQEGIVHKEKEAVKKSSNPGPVFSELLMTDEIPGMLILYCYNGQSCVMG